MNFPHAQTELSPPMSLLESYHLLSYETVDSTNEEARRLAEGGGSHGAVIWAKKQTAGRGRMGRSWVSEEGNLYVSIMLEATSDIKKLGQLSFVTAVALIGALEPLLPHGGKLQSKWPNDILFEGKKIGGILLESFEIKDMIGPAKRWVVVGVGVNIESAPGKVEFPATYLKEAGVEIISAKIVLSRFMYNFLRVYGDWQKRGFANIRRRWLDTAYGIDKPITVRLPDKTLTGIFGGIDRDGKLQLITDGKKQSIPAGDVFFR